MANFGLRAVTCAAAVFGAGLLIGQARAEEATLKTSLIACPSDKTVIGGVNACGKIWALKSGEAELSAEGKVRVELHGLVLNDPTTAQYNGTPDGVDAVAVALVCGAGANASVAAQTDPVKLSDKGDASIEAKLSIPHQCFAPVVLVRERYQGKIGGWLAASGL